MIDNSISNTYNYQTVTAAPNPPIPESCGIDLTLVLDSSGSIGVNNPGNVDYRPDVRRAANAVLKSLRDTNSTARVTQFSTLAQELADRTSINTTTFNDTAQTGKLWNAVNGNTTPYYYPSLTQSSNFFGSWTNWEDALKQASSETQTKPDLVMFVTDGDPTTFGNGSNTQSGFNPAALESCHDRS